VLRALRAAGPGQTADDLRVQLCGRTPKVTTIEAALYELEAAGFVAKDASDDSGIPRWSGSPPPRNDTLAARNPPGPHTLRPAFSPWREAAAIPARVIDELMGHYGGRNGGGDPEQRGTLIGLRYRWTTPKMEACVIAAIEERLAVALKTTAKECTQRVC